MAGPEQHRDPRHKPLLPERRPAETLSLEFRRFAPHTVVSTKYGAGVILNSRDPPVHLPTGTPCSSSTTLRVSNYINYPVTQNNNSAWYYDTGGPPITPSSNVLGTGTTCSSTSRTQPRLPRRRCSGRPHLGWQHCAEHLPRHRCTGAPHRNPARQGAVQHKLHRDVTDNHGRQHPCILSPHLSTTSTPTPQLGCTTTWQPRKDGRRTLSPRATPARPSLSTRPNSPS